ncbi:hypothetical protein [Mycobacterium aquaticum]|uniref:Uncharacterized protein n=1 Tax=Mycobacterium aquaticum TaxID=1927124 RepID=A0A1X0B9D6_9MYCO|nr:hypothetical protein [Mycobacterium aquaticum]ORA38708.1 hypothetical protein BST13_04830 [Mycobacterium aquaticum]
MIELEQSPLGWRAINPNHPATPWTSAREDAITDARFYLEWDALIAEGYATVDIHNMRMGR